MPTGATDATAVALAELFALKASAAKLEVLAMVWQYNSFRHPHNESGRELFFAPSFCNHACAPNCEWDRDAEGRFRLLAGPGGLRAGEDLSISYLCLESLALPCRDRRELLAQSWLFFCLCARCAAEAPPPSCGGCGAPHEVLLSERDEGPYEDASAVCDSCGADDLAPSPDRGEGAANAGG